MWNRGSRLPGAILVSLLVLLALGACRNPVSLEHTTSSGNHTTSSGNLDEGLLELP